MKTSQWRHQYGAVLIFTLVMLTLLTLAGVNMIQQNKQELLMSSNSRQQTSVLASVEQVVTQAESAILNAAVHTPCNPNYTGTLRSSPSLTPPYCTSNPTASVCAQSAACGTPLIPIMAESMCTPLVNPVTSQLVQAPLLAGTPLYDANNNLISATIMSVSCLQDTRNAGIKEHVCSTVASFGNTRTNAMCYPDDNPNNPVACTYQSNQSNGVSSISGDVVTNTIPSGSTWTCYLPYQSDSASALCPTEIYTINVTITASNGAKRTVESRFAVDCGVVTQ